MGQENWRSITVYNTLTRRKEPFVPLAPPTVGMYVCGLTVYDYAHIGHARSALAFETVRRWLAFRGLEVRFVKNVTDVDDKIIDRARELGKDPQKHAAEWAKICDDDLARLGVPAPDVQPKVTEHIPHIVALIERLETRGFAYEAPDGSVYYRVSKKEDYGKLSNRSPADMLAGARIEPAEGKENPGDFALWKAAKQGEPSWDSPWGKGRPGWHIECSAMSLAYLGEQFDIHGGGLDLIFPHHENEIAQSEAATGLVPFARYWMHNGFLTVNGEKMSKSLKNFVTIQDMLKNAEPEVIRFFYANTHYRSPIDYSTAAMEEAGRGLERLRRLRDELAREQPGRSSPVASERVDRQLMDQADIMVGQFSKAMDDDFNTRQAVAELFTFATAANSLLPTNPSTSARQYAFAKLSKMGHILSIFEGPSATATSLVKLLLKLREDARIRKDFATSDEIRHELAFLGVEVSDGKEGTTWRLKA